MSLTFDGDALVDAYIIFVVWSRCHRCEVEVDKRSHHRVLACSVHSSLESFIERNGSVGLSHLHDSGSDTVRSSLVLRIEVLDAGETFSNVVCICVVVDRRAEMAA